MKDEPFLKKLGKKIVKLRDERGISQMELARRLGTGNSQIRLIEVGDANPTIKTLLKIAQELEVSVSELVNI